MDPDSMHRPIRNTRLSVGLLLVIVAALLLPSALLAQRHQSERAKSSVSSPDRTDAGEWYGTWYYKTHKEKWALWMRMEDSVAQLKIQFQNYDTGENFISNWVALSHYASSEKKGFFKLNFAQRDVDLIKGDWFWQLGTPEVDRSVRTETAKFQMYRVASGRQLVLRLDDFERVYEGRNVYTLAAAQAWTFHKASRRLVRWQELPF
jgi:hypothetical protein